MPVAELFVKKYKMQAGNIIGTGSYIPSYVPPDANGLTPEATPFWMVGGAGVEVEVDTETGHVQVTKLINVADVGTADQSAHRRDADLRRRRSCSSASPCRRRWSSTAGRSPTPRSPTTRSRASSTSRAIMQNEAVEAEQGTGPFGAKGVGESGTFGVSPAIANAIEDACGVRLTELPLTAEKVYRALRAAARQAAGGVMRTINFTLNGEKVSAQVAPHQTIVEVLRDRFDLFGARESCAQGLCGCCTVLVDGTAVSGCLYLAALRRRQEGRRPSRASRSDGKLTPIQEAFLEAGAAQCGFCTPGFVLMAGQLLEAHPDPDDDEIRHYLSGNLCRCAAYPEIIAAVKLAAGRLRAGTDMTVRRNYGCVRRPARLDRRAAQGRRAARGRCRGRYRLSSSAPSCGWRRGPAPGRRCCSTTSRATTSRPAAAAASSAPRSTTTAASR